MKRVLYSTYSQIPSCTANSIAVMRMSHELAQLCDFTLVGVRGPAMTPLSVEAYYGVSSFNSVLLPSTALERNDLPLARATLNLARTNWPDICLSRSIRTANVMASAGITVFYELHQLRQDNPAFERAFRQQLRTLIQQPKLQALICMSEELRQQLTDLGCPVQKLTVLHSGTQMRAEPAAYYPTPTRSGQEQNRPVVFYSGSLRKGKGVELLVQIAPYLPTCQFVVVGGSTAEMEDLVARVTVIWPANLIHYAHVVPSTMQQYLDQADILVLPFSRDTDLEYHSPLKLFEYLEAGKPIVASRLWGIVDVLTDEINGLLVEPDNPVALAGAIQRLCSAPDLRQSLSTNARATAERYTWRRRAEQLLALAL